MALATYADLQASIANWAHRTDLTALIPDFVTMAEARISRDLRLRKQITTTTLTTVALTQAVALPSDWLELENLSVAITPERPLSYATIEQLDARFPSGGYTGVPALYTIEGDNILLGPIPDSAYTLNVIYYARFPSLITNSTNWLLTNHPGVYLWSTLIEAMQYAQDIPNMEVYKARYVEALLLLQQQDDAATHSGSALRVRAI